MNQLIGSISDSCVGISAEALKILRHMAQNRILFQPLQLTVTLANAIVYMNDKHWP